jgi:hypothetical protein
MTYVPIDTPLVAVFSNTNQTTTASSYDAKFDKSLHPTARLTSDTQMRTSLDCVLVGDIRVDIEIRGSLSTRFVSSGIKSGAQRAYSQSGDSGGGGGTSSDLLIGRFAHEQNITMTSVVTRLGFDHISTAYYTRAVGVLT